MASGSATTSADRFVMMAPQQRTKRRLDPRHRVFKRLALRRTDRLGVFDPLPVQLGIPPPDLIDLEALPQSLVEVAKLLDSFGTDPECLADDLGRSNDVFARPTIQGRQRRPVERIEPASGPSV